jgi:MFS family permease
MSADVQQHVPFLKQLRSFGGVYWVANWMELVERFAYYGLRTVVGVYMVLALSNGGPGLSHIQKGTIFSIWALVQSFVPIFTGSLADRYGYKLNIAIATALKIAGYLRVLEWEHVFLACAGGVALNFIPLFFFAESARPQEGPQTTPMGLLVGAVRGLLEPRLFFFTLAFAGFWLMFFQLFDILPNFIDDWVDSRPAASALVSVLGEGAVPRVHGGNLTQEWMINLNALLISIFAFLVGFVTGRMRSLAAIIAGIAISAIAIYALGMSMNGWWILGAIALFSVGEMAASPTQLRYLASIAPPGKDGLYMGYSNMTTGIGWSIGSIVAGQMYQESGDKIELAKRYLVDHSGVAPGRVAELERGKVMEFFEKTAGVDAWGARDLLWNTYDPYRMWLTFMLIGLGSMVLLVLYDFVTRRAAANPEHSFNTHGIVWVRAALVPIVLAFVTASIFAFSSAVVVQAVMFGLLLVASFIYKPEPEPKAAVEPEPEEREAA